MRSSTMVDHTVAVSLPKNVSDHPLSLNRLQMLKLITTWKLFQS